MESNKLDKGEHLESRFWNAHIIRDCQDGKKGRMLWQGSAVAYAKIFNMKPKKILSKGSHITDPK